MLASHLLVLSAPLARLAGTLRFALIGALTLVLLFDLSDVAHAAQACSTLTSGQVYCLTKTDAFDPLRVGDTQTSLSLNRSRPAPSRSSMRTR